MKISRALKRRLLRSKYVADVSTSHVKYTDVFKHKSIELYKEGYSPNEVFSKLGFNPEDFAVSYFSGCIERWMKTLEEHKGFKGERRGRPKGKKYDPKDLDQFSKEELKAIIEIQQEILNISKK